MKSKSKEDETNKKISDEINHAVIGILDEHKVGFADGAKILLRSHSVLMDFAIDAIPQVIPIVKEEAKDE